MPFQQYCSWNAFRVFFAGLPLHMLPWNDRSMHGEIRTCFGIYYEAPSGRHILGLKIPFLQLSWPEILVNRPKLESFVTQTARTPLLGLFGSFVKDWIPLINEYYYCTSLSTAIVSLGSNFIVDLFCRHRSLGLSADSTDRSCTRLFFTKRCILRQMPSTTPVTSGGAHAVLPSLTVTFIKQAIYVDRCDEFSDRSMIF